MKPIFPVTGQVIFRDAGKNKASKDGRKLLMVVGVIAVSEDTKVKGEHQYVVVGQSVEQLVVLLDTEMDRSEESKGHALGSLVTLPIWRC